MLINKSIFGHVFNKSIFLIWICGYSLLHSPLSNSDTTTSHLNSIQGVVTIIDNDGNEIQNRSNVVVFIDGTNHNLPVQTQQIIPKMSHLGRQFSPRVLPIVKNDAVDFFNDDRIFHNVFSLSKVKPFDLGIYPQGTSKIVTFKRTGLVRIYCNIHPKMISNILVLNNRFFTKTDIDGIYSINNIPDGDYLLRVWYELGDGVSQKISIKGGKQFSQDWIIKITKKVRGHKNKFGKPYRKKY